MPGVAQAEHVISIIGASGSGKSTFLRWINMLEIPSSGTIRLSKQTVLDGAKPATEAHRAGLGAHRAGLGAQMPMVFQGFNLWSHMTVPENVTVAPMRMMGVSKAEARDRAMARLALVGLADRAQAYPPFNYVNADGKPEGFDVDIVNAICEANGWTCEIVVQDWDGIIPGLLADKYDMIVASTGMTPERAEVVAFSNKYASVPYGFVMSEALATEVEASPGVGIDQLVTGLAGKAIGLVAATASEPYVMDKFGDNATFRSYQKMEDALQDLASGRIDAYSDGVIPISENFLKRTRA